MNQREWIAESEAPVERVYCPNCHVFAGFKVTEPGPEIRTVIIRVGSEEMPPIHIEHLEAVKPRCRFCGGELW